MEPEKPPKLNLNEQLPSHLRAVSLTGGNANLGRKQLIKKPRRLDRHGNACGYTLDKCRCDLCKGYLKARNAARWEREKEKRKNGKK
jgi:hypothetical protein